MTVLFVNMSIDRITGGGTAARTMDVSQAISKDLGADCIVLSTEQGLSDEYIMKCKDSSITLLPCLNERFYIPYFSFFRINFCSIE